jgi:hypothetical protein
MGGDVTAVAALLSLSPRLPTTSAAKEARSSSFYPMKLFIVSRMKDWTM